MNKISVWDALAIMQQHRSETEIIIDYILFGMFAISIIVLLYQYLKSNEDDYPHPPSR